MTQTVVEQNCVTKVVFDGGVPDGGCPASIGDGYGMKNFRNTSCSSVRTFIIAVQLPAGVYSFRHRGCVALLLQRYTLQKTSTNGPDRWMRLRLGNGVANHWQFPLASCAQRLQFDLMRAKTHDRLSWRSRRSPVCLCAWRTNVHRFLTTAAKGTVVLVSVDR